MDGMLSQDEINALLSGMDLSGDEAPDLSGIDLSKPTDDTPKEDFLVGSEAADGGIEDLTDVEKALQLIDRAGHGSMDILYIHS